MKQLDITKHAIQRWSERIDQSADKERAESALRDAFNQATLVYQEGGDLPTQFYLKDDIVFVVVETQIVTVYRAEYGFGGDIDRRICDELKRKLADAQGRLEKAEAAAKKITLSVQQQIDRIQSERRRLELRLKTLESRENKLMETLTQEGRKLDELRHEVGSYARKLVYSIAYRLEWSKLQKMTG